MKIRVWLLSSAPPEMLNKIIAWMLIGLGAVGVIMGPALIIIFRSLFKSLVFYQDYDLPVLNWFFGNFSLLIILLMVLSFWGIILGALVIKKTRSGYNLFLFTNVLLIVINLILVYYGFVINDEIVRLAELIQLPVQEINSLLNSLTLSCFLQGICISVIHIWAIWRYRQADMRQLFTDTV